jgi:hypothetical protein
MTLQQLAEQYLELYDSRLEEDRQCTGWHQLKALVTEGKEELTANDLVAFHPILRDVIRNHWHNIRNHPIGTDESKSMHLRTVQAHQEQAQEPERQSPDQTLVE